MNWEAVGAIGEVVAATVVVLTLIYLAVQMRQSIRATHAATMQAANDSFVNINLAIVSDDALLKVIAGFAEPQSLEEKAKYQIIMISLYRVRETMFMLAKAGTTDARGWERLKPQIRTHLRGDYARAWWRSNSSSFTEEFAAYIDSEVTIIEKAES